MTNQYPTANQYLTVSQVAKEKGISRNAVYKAVREKRLASTLLVGVVAILRRDVEAWEPKSRTGRRKGVRPSEEGRANMSQAQSRRRQKRQSEN